MTLENLRYVGRKTLRKLQGRNNEQFASGPDSDSFGRKMLERMGWAEGEGVGKNKTGIKEHIRAVKRGAEGLGAKAGDGRFEGDNAKSCLEDGWYLRVFDDAKSKKKKKKKKKKSKKSKKRKRGDSDGDDSDDGNDPPSPSVLIPSDEALLRATGGARLGRRAQPSWGEKGKLQRIAAADAAFLAKYGGGSSAVPANNSTSTPAKKKVRTDTKAKGEPAQRFSWSEATLAELRSAGSSLPVKKLQKRVVKLARASGLASDLDKKALKAKFTKKLGRNSGVRIDGKTAHLL